MIDEAKSLTQACAAPDDALHGAEVLDPASREQLAELVRMRGEAAVRDALGAHRTGFARMLAGLRVRRGTIALALQYLKERA